MTDILDAELVSHAQRARGKVVLITGGANGIGREMALQFASYGAKIVIGDVQTAAGEKVVEEIKAAGGAAAFQRCDVTVWEEQHELFKFALATYGTVDVVIPNAGVTEKQSFLQSVSGSAPVKPNLLTLNINLTAVLYTTHLAVFYLGATKQGWNKALVFIGSIASILGIPVGPQYSASKHGVIGLMGSVYDLLHSREIRVGLVAPFFTDTAILDAPIRVALAGVPFANIKRASGAALAIATHPDPQSNGCVWTVPDEKTVFRMTRDEMNQGGYKLLMDRVKRLFVAAGFITQTLHTLSDLSGLVPTSFLVFAVAVALGGAVWKTTT
ncbi:NAD(P)-binding protein [Auriculariales sp. MPI-PUGE-AT-0066]|nr:NAD(P)-binding protein [Auriculariales sp. MPI-PUGE-AT-0066]